MIIIRIGKIQIKVVILYAILLLVALVIIFNFALPGLFGGFYNSEQSGSNITVVQGRQRLESDVFHVAKPKDNNKSMEGQIEQFISRKYSFISKLEIVCNGNECVISGIIVNGALADQYLLRQFATGGLKQAVADAGYKSLSDTDIDVYSENDIRFRQTISAGS